MAVLKCKMCGGELNVSENTSVVECEFCGTKQTVPTSKDENLQGLFNRANILRMKSEFDKAAEIYEKIIQNDETQAEAYWGLILCKYGIEYVEDPQSFKRIPTCHRTSFDSIISDEDYKSALSYADSVQREIYESEAKEIDKLQKDILSIVNKEEPFDVFICYKETGSDGKRTQDSVIANDIYHQLTQEGLKVFYAAITLEDKLGTAYEPYIFAALNSAKVMLVIGTKSEYFNAVWVKNEWSRFLKLIKKDHAKTLIPCYRDMDAYELPEEFAHLQAQDMSKIGFINDVVRGIKKIVEHDEPKEAASKETVVAGNNANTASLLERAFMFLEDGDWDSADEYCEKVLDIDPKCAKAYLGKLMAELKVCKRAELENYYEPFDDNNNYKKTIRFADDELKDEIQCYAKASSYNKAIGLMNTGIRENAENAIAIFNSIAEYKDSEKQIELCKKNIKDKSGAIRRQIQKNVPKIIRPTIQCGTYYTVGLKSDGTVVANGNNGNGECDVSDWEDIVAIAAGGLYTVGLKSDRTVVATKYTSALYERSTRHGQCEVSDWKDIVAIAAGGGHTVGLKSDGTVIATEYTENTDYYFGQCDVDDWKNIVAISASESHTVGLNSDGTVVATGIYQREVSDWKDIVAISAGHCYTVGLKSDGTVVANGNKGNGECDVYDWEDIVAISAGDSHTVGLKSDGTVIATEYIGDFYFGQCEVSDWKDIVAISAGGDHTVGLKSDGTVIATEYIGDSYRGEYDVADWKDIALPPKANSLEELLAQENEISKKRAEEKRIKAEQLRQAEHQKAEYRSAGVCQHCGGKFKGFFTKTCTGCGRRKDY